MKTSHRKTVSSPKQYLLLIFSLLSRFFTKWKGIHIIFRSLMSFCCEPDFTYGRLISIVSHIVWWMVKGKTTPYPYIIRLSWWPWGLWHNQWLLTVSHHCPGSNPGWGMCESFSVLIVKKWWESKFQNSSNLRQCYTSRHSIEPSHLSNSSPRIIPIGLNVINFHLCIVN